MPRKLDPDKTHGQKMAELINYLLLTSHGQTLGELAQQLNCAKSTVYRIIRNIETSSSFYVDRVNEGRMQRLKIKQKRRSAVGALTAHELAVLQMCRDFTRGLLGEKLFRETTEALRKSESLLEEGPMAADGCFGAFAPGRIDYTPFQDSLSRLIEAIGKRLICKVSYQSQGASKPKDFYIMPLKLFSHRETIYLHSRRATEKGQRFKKSGFDPLLAVHRFKNVEITETPFVYPKDFDFEAAFNNNFGIMKEKPFTVQAAFWGWAARYVAERTWSNGQAVKPIEDGGIELTFESASVAEVIGWLLSFGPDAEVLEPQWLRQRVVEQMDEMIGYYRTD